MVIEIQKYSKRQHEKLLLVAVGRDPSSTVFSVYDAEEGKAQKKCF